jgi:carbamoyl-phosphate synthase/aspartate carbamoyltransferase
MVAPAHDEVPAGTNPVSPGSPAPAAMVAVARGVSPAASTRLPVGSLYPPASSKGIDFMAGETEWDDSMGRGDMVLELADGLALSGHSFGADKSISGECVFQTGELL